MPRLRFNLIAAATGCHFTAPQFFAVMDAPILIDYPSVARQVIKLFDVRQKAPFTHHSLLQARGFSKDDSRYYSIAALIATAIEPRRAGAVTKKLLPALDAYQNEKRVDLPPEELESRRAEFVERFLKLEYAGQP
jgi:hypothetical protein